jgi:hypothetical protein
MMWRSSKFIGVARSAEIISRVPRRWMSLPLTQAQIEEA